MTTLAAPAIPMEAPQAQPAQPRPTGAAPDATAETAAGTVTGSIAGDLLAVLEAQAEVCDDLIALAEERHAALVAADADRLSDLVGREQPLLTRMRRLEAARVQVIRPWAARLATNAERLTVSDLVGLVDTGTASALQQARDGLLAKIQQLGQANDVNAGFLQACLDSVNSSIAHLLQTVQLDPRYASGGNRASQQEDTPRLTDFRA